MMDDCLKRRRRLELADARKQHSFAARRKPVPFLSNSCLNLPIAAEAEKRAEGKGAFAMKGERRRKNTTTSALFLPLRTPKAVEDGSGKDGKKRRNVRETRGKRTGRQEKLN